MRSSGGKRGRGLWLGRRAPHPLLASVAVPVAVVAAVLSDQLWTTTLLAPCAWWWAPREPRWGWLGGLVAGFGGAVWAMLGIDALTSWPGQRLAVGTVWAGIAAALAAGAWLTRQLAGGP